MNVSMKKVKVLWKRFKAENAAEDSLKKLHLDEAAIVYIADKAVQEDERVRLIDRFDDSRDKCQTSDALKAWQARKDDALTLQTTINTLCGKEILP